MLVFGLLKKITIHEVNPRRKFIYGPGIDEPVCMINVDTAGNEQLYFYHYDGLGSVIALSDVNGNIVEQYTYTPFGTPTISTTPGHTSPNNPYMFTARRGACPVLDTGTTNQPYTTTEQDTTNQT